MRNRSSRSNNQKKNEKTSCSARRELNNKERFRKLYKARCTSNGRIEMNKDW
jgi:hypothetical protein